MTGRYPCGQLGEPNQAVPDGVPLLAERLRRVGYRTAGFVSPPYLGKKYGFQRGFETFDEHSGGTTDQLPHVLKWLKRQGEAPFFLFFHTFSVHGPYRAPPEIVARYAPDPPARDATDPRMTFLRGVGIHSYLQLEQYRSLEQLVAHYDAGIRHVDDQLGRFVSRLRELGLYDNSVVVVTSDHGESLFDREIWVGHGLFLYDDEVRIPLIVKPAGKRPALRSVDAVVQSVDVVPTVLELLGQPVPEGLDGRSLVGLIGGRSPSGHTGFALGVSSSMGDMAYLRTDRWKYITPSGFPLERVLGFLKPAEGSDLPNRIVLQEQLFDLHADPGERTNLAAKNPEVAGKLRTELHEILARCEAAATEEAGDPVHLTEEERKRLESLGYVD